MTFKLNLILNIKLLAEFLKEKTTKKNSEGTQ